MGRGTKWRKIPQMKSLSSGFTLIEVLIASTILSVLLASFYQLLSFLRQDYQGQIAIAETDQESRVALSLFQNEIQNAGLDPTGLAFLGPHTSGRVPVFTGVTCLKQPQSAEAILEASETVFHFMGDQNGSRTFDRKNEEKEEQNDRNEDVRYEWVGQSGRDVCRTRRDPYTLYRNTGAGQQEVALGMTDFKLRYFDENGEPLPVGALNQTERLKIRKVRLTIQSGFNKKNNRRGREWNAEIYLKNIG
jgi:prepilin-type N-terminal cleavage/methylation domain-containing protein